jgi:single-stranded DNA-binding protein
MNNTQNENNIANISGKIVLEPKFSHEIYGEGFYNFSIEISRLSKSEDKIIVTVSERLIPIKELVIGKFVYVEGQFRSYNNYSGEGSKLLLTVFAREVSFIEGDEQNKNQNQIFLNGYICKKPVYRTTPFGREIADILVAVNRHYNKSDYIPCITWGRNARFSSNLHVGDNIKIWGRIQSREYQKKLEGAETLTKIAYEVSIAKIESSEGDETNKEDENLRENIDENVKENTSESEEE